jgi:hypothetical protein
MSSIETNSMLENDENDENNENNENNESTQLNKSKIKESKTSCHLELGDVIEISAPNNQLYDKQTFYILFIDDEKMSITNIQNQSITDIKFDKDGNIRDESIIEISLLGRSEEKGYARQHMLLPNTWVDIHFGGEVPTIITGEITNLEEDMIEITTYPDLGVIYIDFQYKGIPKDIPIEQILIRTKPASLDKIESLINIKESIPDDSDFDIQQMENEPASSMEYLPSGEMLINVPESVEGDKTLKQELTSMYRSANEIIYGQDLGELVQEIELSEQQKRYGIETQTNDMLNVLLSQVPNKDRTDRVKNDIHLLIQRFRELRNKFSKFDDNGNLYDMKLHGIGHKPLSEHIFNLDTKLKWVMPVVSLKRKVYMPNNQIFEDVSEYKNTEVLTKDADLQEDYLKNRLQSGSESAYVKYNQELNQSFVPYESPSNDLPSLTFSKEIQSSLESIVQNLDNFYSTVIGNDKNNVQYLRKQYVIQKYNLGNNYLEPKMSKTGRKVFIRNQMTPNESINVQSMMMLPKPVFYFSNIDLPGSSILQKSQYSQNFLYLYKIFNKKLTINNHVIDDFNKELDKDVWENALSGSFENEIQHFSLGESLENRPERFQKFSQSIIPDTQNIVRLMEKFYDKSHFSGMLATQRFVNKLEPFLIYNDDLNYSQYNAIRYFIKEQRKEFLVKMSEKKDEFTKYRESLRGYNSQVLPHVMEKILEEKKDMFSVISEYYHINHDKKDTVKLDSFEWLSKMYKSDGIVLFSNMIALYMNSLISPESLMDSLQLDENDDMSNIEKIKADDCARRIMSKKYGSLKDLQKDNGEKEVFYDKEFDDSPYDLLDKYKDEKKKFGNDEFQEFLEEVLVQKHEYPPKIAIEVAENMVLGKKMVREGEYALLEIVPKLPEATKISDLTQLEKEELLKESDILKKTAYYKRMGNHWVHDESVDEEAFINNNTLFCNMSKICFKDRKTNVCDDLPGSTKTMKLNQKKKILDEFDQRFAESSEQIQEKTKERVELSMKHLKQMNRLREVQLYKYNIIAHEMGKYIKEISRIKSPNAEQLENILGQDDFPKKQQDIVQFSEQFCRDPMVEELGDNQYWLYCSETNVKLLPKSLFQLAHAFVSNEDYSATLNDIIRKQGIVDGDSVYDKECNCVLQKLDFVDESNYDEHGLKIVSNDVIEKDALEVTVTALQRKRKISDRVFENPESEMVFKLIRSLCGHIGISSETIEDECLRMTLELINETSNVKSERIYKLDAKEALDKSPPQKLPPYEIYRNKMIILITTSVLLVCIQTQTPPFKTQKTFPGCVQSFRGFPDHGGAIEDTSGLDYMVCILGTIKMKSAKPWNSIKPLPIEILKQNMIQIIKQAILPRNDIINAYVKKDEYLLEHPDLDIPNEYSIQQWVQFLPPVIPFEITKTLKGLPSDYKNELDEMQKTGNNKQRIQIAMFKSKITQFSFAIVENINKIVRSKGLLLKTASNIFFTENACCNDKKTNTCLSYFEDNNKELMVYNRMIRGWEQIINDVKQRSVAPFLFDPRKSGLTYDMGLQQDHFEKNVYLAFIRYCNLDTQAPIPMEIRALFPEKLTEYNPRVSLTDKINFLKENGKKFSNQNLLQLMDIVNKRNIITNNTVRQKGNDVSAIQDLFQYVQEQNNDDDDIPLCSKFRDLMNGVLNKYNPKSMIAEDSEETYKLNNWLSHANTNLLERIVEFVGSHAKMPRSKKKKLEEQLANVHIWNMDETYEYGKGLTQKDETSMYNVTQFIRESVFSISRVYPEIIMNNHDHSSKVHKHWNFVNFHEQDISKFIADSYEGLNGFKNDRSLKNVLQHVQESLTHLSTFLNLIPAFLPIHVPPKDEQPALSYHSLFTKRTLYMIYSYVYYSTLYEYIKAADNDELLQVDFITSKTIRREDIQNERSNAIIGTSNEEDLNEVQEQYADDLEEVQIVAGQHEQLKIRIGELLLTLINMEMNNKKTVDLKYGDIQKRITRSRLNEKKMITDFLKNMDDDERRVEDTKKILKLGRWNVGLKKGLVNYDKARYVEERNQLFDQMANPENIDIEDSVIQVSVQDLEQQDNQEIDDFYEEEANDIRNFMGDDADGAYYEEDIDDDFREN